MSSDTAIIELSSFSEIWLHLTIWTVTGTSLAFFIAGVWMARLNKTFHQWLWLPLLLLVTGFAVGLVQGSLSAVLIAGIYVSVPYSIGIDVAAGLGVGQALVIIYLHLGRASFVRAHKSK
jgi:hypothetical protein